MGILMSMAMYELGVQVSETCERHRLWRQARLYCNKSNKQLLRIGVRRGRFEPPNGDVTLDIDPVIQKIPGGVLGDERAMPFRDKQFGVCFNEHTLEHLHSADGVARAIKECIRVSDVAMFLFPSHLSILANFVNHTHFLRLRFFQGLNLLAVQENWMRTGLGSLLDAPARDNAGNIVRMSQHFIVGQNKAPTIVNLGNRGVMIHAT